MRDVNDRLRPVAVRVTRNLFNGVEDVLLSMRVERRRLWESGRDELSDLRDGGVATKNSREPREWERVEWSGHA